MALVIRLMRMGKRGERKFRVVVKEKRSKRDGNAIETLGWYEKREKEIRKEINRERLNYWVSVGAKPTDAVRKIA